MAFGPDIASHATAVLAATSITWSHTCGAGATKLVIAVGAGASALADRSVNTVTYNGVTCAKLGTADDTVFEHSEIWRLNSPATGSSLSIVVSMTGAGANQLAAGAISYIDAATAEGAPSSNTATTINPTVTVADSASGDHVISMSSNDNSTVATTEAGTLVWEDEDVGADSDFNCQRQVASGANTVCSWTNSSSGGGWAAVGIAIKPLAGVATSNPPPSPSVPSRRMVSWTRAAM